MTDTDKFNAAVEAAMSRQKGLHGSVGTQNEKLIHAALKNYYAEHSDEQEIKIGDYYADAVNERGIIEIQSKRLYKLLDKLKAFLEFSRVTVVHPVPCGMETLYINEDSGEVVKETPMRNLSSLHDAFDELYTLRSVLNDENLRIILARIKISRRVYFRGNTLPDMTTKRGRKKCRIEKVPVELCGETALECKADYAALLPKGLPDEFTKREFTKASGETYSSLRLEVLRTVGVIEQIGTRGRYYLYKSNF